MTWTRMPTGFGWWFFAPEKALWDLARPVHVSAVSVNGGPARFHRNHDPDAVITPGRGWWYGPVTIARPDLGGEDDAAVPQKAGGG